MSSQIELYKAFIDGLVERKGSLAAKLVKDIGYPKLADKAKNDFLMTLSDEQKNLLAAWLQEEHIEGIFTALAYINEQMDLNGLELRQEGKSLPNDHFVSLHFDFMARCADDEWPE